MHHCFGKDTTRRLEDVLPAKASNPTWYLGLETDTRSLTITIMVGVVVNVTSHLQQKMRRDNNGDDDYFLDSYSHSKYYPHEGNSSITTSVTIHVTPEHYHVFNWVLLWTGFVLGILLASYQVRQENMWAASKERRDDIEQQQQSGNGVVMVTEGEGGVSSADWTRSRVRQRHRILLCGHTKNDPEQDDSRWFKLLSSSVSASITFCHDYKSNHDSGTDVVESFVGTIRRRYRP